MLIKQHDFQVKVNQLQHLESHGRTGHWLNHSKEHCIIGKKGKPKHFLRMDCDVVVSQPRENSRKPEEIYDVIERCCILFWPIAIFNYIL